MAHAIRSIARPRDVGPARPERSSLKIPRAAPKVRNCSNAGYAFEQDFAGARSMTVGRKLLCCEGSLEKADASGGRK